MYGVNQRLDEADGFEAVREDTGGDEQHDHAGEAFRHAAVADFEAVVSFARIQTAQEFNQRGDEDGEHDQPAQFDFRQDFAVINEKPDNRQKGQDEVIQRRIAFQRSGFGGFQRLSRALCQPFAAVAVALPEEVSDGDEEQRDDGHRHDGLEAEGDEVGVGFFRGEDDIGGGRREIHQRGRGADGSGRRHADAKAHHDGEKRRHQENAERGRRVNGERHQRREDEAADEQHIGRAHMAQRLVEDADDDVVRADVRHIGGKTDEDHDDHAERAAAVFKEAVDVVADIGHRIAAGGFGDGVAHGVGDGHQRDADAEKHAFGVVAFDDEATSGDERCDAKENAEVGAVHDVCLDIESVFCRIGAGERCRSVSVGRVRAC